MREQSIDRVERAGTKETIADLLAQVANNSADLVRSEIHLARQELNERIRMLSTHLITSALGAMICVLGLLSLLAASVIGLGTLIGMGLSALVIGAALLIVGVVVGMTGLSRVKATRLKPVKTIETLEEDKEWLKQLI